MPTKYTSGFISPALQTRHYQKHVVDKEEFDCSEDEYVEKADEFLGLPLNPDTQEYVRKYGLEAGDVVRDNSVTEKYGVLSKDGNIITYFIADYQYGTNQEYFELEKVKDEAKK